MSKLYETKFLMKISKVFSSRKHNKNNHIQEYIFCEEESNNELLKLSWYELDNTVLESSTISFLNTDDFKYYLPGVMKVSIEEKNPYLLAIETIIYYLDRPPNRRNWDNGFIEKWKGFNIAEYELVKEWLYIINQLRNDEDIESIFRCMDTIDLLIEDISSQ